MGFFDKIFRKQSDTKDADEILDNSSQPESNIMVFPLMCRECGNKYEVGRDAIIYSGVVPADGALRPMKNPDIIKPHRWRRMSESEREAQRGIYGAIMASKILAMKNEWSRIWKCPSCGKVNYWKDNI